MNSQAHEHFDAFPSVVNKYMTAIRGATASDQAGRCADLLRHYLRTAAEHRRITAEKERAMQR